ncbi:MAG: AtpZ/AtpI family protein [Fimbriiglobus sp.]
MSRPKSSQDFSDLAFVGPAVGEMVVPVLVGVWADGRFGSGPWGLLLGATLGVVGGFTHLVIHSRRRMRSTDK